MSHVESPSSGAQGPSSNTGRIAVAWAVVGIPLVYGISQTVVRAADLFIG